MYFTSVLSLPSPRLPGFSNLGTEELLQSLFSTVYVTVDVFTVAVLVFIGSLAVKILQARENPDLSEFMDKISLSSGTLAVTLELLIMVPALGWFQLWGDWKELFVVRNVDDQLAMESDQKNGLP
ncbi:hypothetical protein DVH24_037033 [Malus domestica]|uniref:Uncharacterized protein n=1 Tax=Malus domestica TaxID=3750 RepID=A0A498HDX8_MALDO|nr:hypothetical protein DVH24_037033 [Malus domestica]